MYIVIKDEAFHLLSKIVRFHLRILSSRGVLSFYTINDYKDNDKVIPTIFRIRSSPDLHLYYFTYMT